MPGVFLHAGHLHFDRRRPHRRNRVPGRKAKARRPKRRRALFQAAVAASYDNFDQTRQDADLAALHGDAEFLALLK